MCLYISTESTFTDLKPWLFISLVWRWVEARGVSGWLGRWPEGWILVSVRYSMLCIACNFHLLSKRNFDPVDVTHICVGWALPVQSRRLFRPGRPSVWLCYSSSRRVIDPRLHGAESDSDWCFSARYTLGGAAGGDVIVTSEEITVQCLELNDSFF